MDQTISQSGSSSTQPLEEAEKRIETESEYFFRSVLDKEPIKLAGYLFRIQPRDVLTYRRSIIGILGACRNEADFQKLQNAMSIVATLQAGYMECGELCMIAEFLKEKTGEQPEQSPNPDKQWIDPTS